MNAWPDEFIPLIAPKGPTAGAALWFIFRDEQILARTSGTRADVLACANPADLGLVPVRTQYLGLLAGQHCIAAEVPPETAALDGFAWIGLRGLFGLLDDAHLALAGRARQIVEWDRSHQYCGRCGTPTELSSTERARVCPACGQPHYPRVSPVVMALVRNDDRLLLARSARFLPGMYSALAGFVEAGESLEQSLVREVREEVGVDIATPRYFSSQSWPFPHSLMIAFVCDYAGGEIRVDPGEIEDARWFSIDSLPDLPNPLSIARRLIDATVAAIRGEHQSPRARPDRQRT